MHRLYVFMLVIVFLPNIVSGASVVSFATSPLWLSAMRIAAGKSIIISTAVMKTGDESITGGVTFYANEKQVGSSDFSLGAHTYGAMASVSWVPAPGTYNISAKITRAVIARDGKEETLTVSTEVKASETLLVLLDTDGDGIPDIDDPDDDNDGMSDADERRGGTDPLVKNTLPKSQVAGVSTSTIGNVFQGAADVAQSTGSTLFQASEKLRKTSGDYIDKKIKTIAAEPMVATSTADMLWWWSGVKTLGLKILSFFLKNIYAFYILLILLTLWIIRKIWSRYSLD